MSGIKTGHKYVQTVSFKLILQEKSVSISLCLHGGRLQMYLQ